MRAHFELKVRNYPPRTSRAQGDSIRKSELREIILEQNTNIDEIRQWCKNKKLLLDIVFKLVATHDGTHLKTDLDNLLKILLDVLKEKNNENSETMEGIGIIEGDKDYLIYELNCKKEVVNQISDAGIDIKIFEFQ